MIGNVADVWWRAAIGRAPRTFACSSTTGSGSTGCRRRVAGVAPHVARTGAHWSAPRLSVVTPQLLQLLVEGLGKAERSPPRLSRQLPCPSPVPRPTRQPLHEHTALAVVRKPLPGRGGPPDRERRARRTERVTDQPVLRGGVALAALPVVVFTVEPV